jgi:pSer/pThr/pTyr-binding forkhead associated (FHA) protein
MAASPARLVVRHGPTPNQEHTLVLNTNIIGREPINDVVFADAEVSRRHARIILQNGHYYIEDLGSTNGTFVNGRRIQAITKLGNGDIVDLGESVRLTFVRQDDDTTGPAAAVAPPTAAPAAAVTTVHVSAPLEEPAPPPTTYENHQNNRRNMYIALAVAAVFVLICSCVIILGFFQFVQIPWLSNLGGG